MDDTKALDDVDTALRRVNFLCALGDEQRERFRSHSSIVKVPAGRLLAKVGSLAEEIYFILQGGAKISNTSREGKEALVAVLPPGAHIGLVSLLSSLPRTTDVLTTCRCTLLRIDGRFFHAELQRSPQLCHSFLCSLAFRLEQTSRHFMEVAILSLNHRLFARLFELAVPTEFDGVEKLLVRERPSHQDLANMLGSSREAITRSLRQLEEAGNIVVEDNQVFVISTPS